MLIGIAAFVALVVVVLGTEAQLARRGEELVTPDVATLAATFAPTAGTPTTTTRILWLGDSTAAAVGASDPAHAVSTQVAERVIAHGTRHALDVTVIAHSGDRIGDVEHNQLPHVAALRPDVVVISIGANDTIHLTGKRRFGRTYTRVLNALVNNGVARDHIVLVGVPDMGASPRFKQPLRAITGLRGERLDREVERVAKEANVRYVDLFDATSSQFRAKPSTYLAGDNYHPGDAGYSLWANAIAPTVIKVVG